MPRPIEFDPNQALNDAMLLFWRQGYHQTSMRDLTGATRLKPGSLYAAFRNKRALFLLSLDHYSESLRESVDKALRNDQPPLSRIHAFFSRLIDETGRDPQQKGCLLVNTLLETPAEDSEITLHATKALRYVEQAFIEVLEEAKERGDLHNGLDSTAQARLLMAGIFGLRVYSKMDRQKKTLRSIVDRLLVSLEPWSDKRACVQ